MTNLLVCLGGCIGRTWTRDVPWVGEVCNRCTFTRLHETQLGDSSCVAPAPALVLDHRSSGHTCEVQVNTTYNVYRSARAAHHVVWKPWISLACTLVSRVVVSETSSPRVYLVCAVDSVRLSLASWECPVWHTLSQ